VQERVPGRDDAGRLERLSEDHEDFFGSLTACLGAHGPGFFQVGFFQVPVGSGLAVLLASDGLFGEIEDDELGELLCEGGLDAVVAEAEERSSDNITAVLVDVDAFARG
jgi:serine/threonine protein phosphatase PrpC